MKYFVTVIIYIVCSTAVLMLVSCGDYSQEQLDRWERQDLIDEVKELRQELRDGCKTQTGYRAS